MLRISVLCLALIVCVTSDFIPEQHTGIQSYRVVGRLFCGDKPADQVRVKLVDDDFGPDPDDDLDSGYTDSEGYFELAGDTTELTTIDPHLKIYHDCNDGLTPCQRRWKFELPNHYITSGKKPTKTLDIGVWNLETKMPDLNGNFGTKSAWFFFDLLVTSDYMIPITQNLDNTTFNTNDPIEYFVRQNATVNIPNPAGIIGVYADISFFYNLAVYPRTVFRTGLVQITPSNYTTNKTATTVQINSNDTSINGSITFSYRIGCSNPDGCGINCTSIWSQGPNEGVCSVCNATTGTSQCCSGYYPPYCNSTDGPTTTLNPSLESTTTSNDKKLKDIYFWVMIGLGIIIIILLILLIVCCIMSCIYKNQATNREREESIAERNAERHAERQRPPYPVQTQIVESPKQNRLPPPQNYESKSPRLAHQQYESRNPPLQTYESRTLPPVQTTFPRTAPHHPRNVNRQRHTSDSSEEWNYVIGREDDV